MQRSGPACRTNAEAPEEALRCDVVFDRVGHFDAAYGAYAAIVERAQSFEKVFLQAPGFATNIKNAQDQSAAYPAIYTQDEVRLERTYLRTPNADVSALFTCQLFQFWNYER